MPDKAIFLDRDNTLIEDPGYINNPDQVKLLEGVPEVLIALKAMGYKLVVVSNQSGVARGIMTEETLAQIHKRLEQLLAESGASLDRVYYCPYHPDGAIPKYRRESDLRKPNPGMLLAAGKDMDIDLTESWMVGNGPCDIEAGARAGCRTIMVDSRRHERLQPGQLAPDYRAVNLKEVINIIKMHARSADSGQQTADSVQRTADSVLNAERRCSADDEPSTDSALRPRFAQGASDFAIATPDTTQSRPSSLRLRSGQAEQTSSPQTTEQLLSSILGQLKLIQRSQIFGESEFSILRFIAGVVQVAAGFCLLIGVWFLLGPDKQADRLLITLGFAAVLQIMALTLYTIRGPR